VLAVRLQEVFGLSDTPKVNKQQISVVMHLLSPGYKPVQVTSDLRSFWNNTYHEVKKELQRRYPKHAWPEDAWKAEPVRKGKSSI
jgi:ATP-dependent helicase HrpB